MGRVDLDANGDASGARVNGGGYGAEGLGKHDVRTAMKQSHDLGVPLDRHRRDGPFRRELEELEAHFEGERAASGVHEPPH